MKSSLTDPRAILKAQTPSQAQVQDQRRRANLLPSIETAQAAADLARTIEPVGSSRTWWGLSDPEGGFYMTTDGRELDPVAYPDLFEVLGLRFNTGGETSGFFRLPSTIGRAIVGAGAVDGDEITDRIVGDKFGFELNILTTPQLPIHGHPATASVAANGEHSHGGSSTDNQPEHSHGMGFAGASNFQSGGGSARVMQSVGGSFASGSTDNGGGHGHGVNVTNQTAHTHTTTISVANAGEGLAHNNLQPSIAAFDIIRVLP